MKPIYKIIIAIAVLALVIWGIDNMPKEGIEYVRDM